MGVVLVSEDAYKASFPDSNVVLFSNLEFDDLIKTLIAATTEDVSLIMSADSVNGIQDELFLVAQSAPSFMSIIGTYLSKVITTNGEYIATEQSRNVLFNVHCSKVESLESCMMLEGGFDPKDFVHQVLLLMFKNQDLRSEKNYSDVSISVGAEVMFRPPGLPLDPISKSKFCNSVDSDKMTVDEVSRIKDYLLSTVPLMVTDNYVKIGFVRLSYALTGYGRVRITLYNQRGTPTIAIRRIPTKTYELSDYYLPKSVENHILSRPAGLNIVGGKPNTGKTALLGAVTNLIKDFENIKIVEIANPIEYTHSHGLGIVNQIEIGVDIDSLDSALKMLKTDDVDVVIITEIRTRDDWKSVIEFCNSGACVFTSTHVGAVSDVFDIVKTMFGETSGEYDMFLKNVKTIIHQNLVPKIGGGLTPVHGILYFSDSAIPLRPNSNSSTIKDLQLKQPLGYKHEVIDLYNLYISGIVDRSELVKRGMIEEKEDINKQVDLVVYHANNQCAPTLLGRR